MRGVKTRGLGDIVQVYLLSFWGSFLTVLGPGFLKVLYQEIHLHSAGILQVAEARHKITGFAILRCMWFVTITCPSGTFGAGETRPRCWTF